MSQAIRIAQGQNIKITLHQKLPVQVDGEPWAQEPCSIHVEFHKQVRMLHKSNDACSFRTVTETAEDPLIKYKRANNLLKVRSRRYFRC